MRRADALHDLATRALGADPDPDRATVVIHADAKVIDGEVAGNGFIGDVAICHSTLMRALCDARVEVALHSPDGPTVGIARASQQIPHWQRRQIIDRDQCCRWAGCQRKIRQIHHIKFWSNGGQTNSDNLAGFCWTHHQHLHEGRWTIEGNPNGTITLINPDGQRRLTSTPQPLNRDTRQRVEEMKQGRATQQAAVDSPVPEGAAETDPDPKPGPEPEREAESDQLPLSTGSEPTSGPP